MGVFIYKTKGSFPDKFIMEAIDILLMAKGSSAEVGYITDHSLISDLCDLGYEEHSRALIHSHNTMGVTPSTTDINQLKEAASTGPYYLSVIVNNNLDVKALVGIKHTYTAKVKSTFKNLFGKVVNSKTEEKTYEDYEIIDCEVELQKPQYMIDIDNRIATKIQDYNIAPHSKRSGYIKQQKVVKIEKQEPVQLSLELAGENEYKQFIPAALTEYCFYSTGQLKSAYNAANSIWSDESGFGIPLQAYLDYLKGNTYHSPDFTKRLINEIQETIESLTTVNTYNYYGE